MDLFPGYCIDTNALIDLWRRRYPPDIFPTLWSLFEQLLDQGQVIAPKEVLKELEKRDDELLRWAKKRHVMFRDLDEPQLGHLRRLLRDHKDLIDPYAESPKADPFIIALAQAIGWTVITSEMPGKNKIPTLCAEYGIKCFQLLEFFRERNWSF